MPELRACDVVRVQSLPALVDACSSVAPGLGDHGAVVDVLQAGDAEDRLRVESCDSRGRTMWLAEFSREAVGAAPFSPCEPLNFEVMASGERSLNLGRDVPWSAFPDYTTAVAARLGATIVDDAEDPLVRLRTMVVEGARYWLAWDVHSECVSLEPCDARAGARMLALREILRASRGSADAVFRVRDDPGALPRLDTGVAALDFLLRDELGTGGALDEDSLTLELAYQVGDVRLGRAQRVTNGSDAIFVTIEPASVLLEYAIPGAPRPGVRVTLHSFAHVFAQWFDRVNPALGPRVRELIWPPAVQRQG